MRQTTLSSLIALKPESLLDDIADGKAKDGALERGPAEGERMKREETEETRRASKYGTDIRKLIFETKRVQARAIRVYTLWERESQVRQVQFIRAENIKSQNATQE